MKLPPEIRAAIGTPSRLSPMERGATSRVWQVEAKGKIYVFKQLVGRPPNCGLSVDAHIRDVLKAQGGAVAAPVAHGHNWGLDRYVHGVHLPRGELPKAACHALGETLACLHAIKVEGFGPPALLASGCLSGAEATPIAGINTRFSGPVPDELAQNPACKADPRLCKALPPMLAQLRAALSKNRTALCHSDLHERQFIVENDNLKALIDFGGVTLADPRWDLGSLLYFHGPEVVNNVLDGYAEGTLSEAYLFSIGIALHHANRSAIEGKGHRLAVAIAHLRKALAFLSKKRAGQ